MMPDRSGGSPTYAYAAYKDRWPTFAGHVNGITAWGYWLGWFPVAPLNMILASFYIASLFKPEHHRRDLAPRYEDRLVDDRHRGRRDPAAVHPLLPGSALRHVFATALALLSMIPLTFLAISWIFNPSVVDFSQLTHFQHTNGTGFFHLHCTATAG